MSLSPATTLAYKHLATYPKTEKQTRDYLAKKGFESNEIDAAIQDLIDLKALDDKLYAEMYLNSEVARKGKPIVVAQQKLYQKGIGTDITQELIDECNEDYLLGMYTALKKLWSQKKDTDDTQKRIKRMIGRGYEYGLVLRVSNGDS